MSAAGDVLLAVEKYKYAPISPHTLTRLRRSAGCSRIRISPQVHFGEVAGYEVSGYTTLRGSGLQIHSILNFISQPFKSRECNILRRLHDQHYQTKQFFDQVFFVRPVNTLVSTSVSLSSFISALSRERANSTGLPSLAGSVGSSPRILAVPNIYHYTCF